MKKIKAPESLPVQLKKTETLVNKFIRERDHGERCISCGSDKANQAGHYFAVKKCSYLRYHPVNINLQCAYCNLFLHGNESYYRMGLVDKWGEEAVRALEELARSPRNKVFKWSRFELEQIQNEIKAKIYGQQYQPLTRSVSSDKRSSEQQPINEQHPFLHSSINTN